MNLVPRQQSDSDSESNAGFCVPTERLRHARMSLGYVSENIREPAVARKAAREPKVA